MTINQKNVISSILRTTTGLAVGFPLLITSQSIAQQDVDTGSQNTGVPALTYTIQELPVLEENRPWRSSNATGMNEAGHVVGIAQNDLGMNHAVIWIDGQIALAINESPTEDLRFWNGKGINNHDDIVGQGSQPLPSGGWVGSPMAHTADLGIFNPDDQAPRFGWSWAINDSLQIGFSGGGTFVFDPIDGVREIGFPGLAGKDVWEINNAGQVTGSTRLQNTDFGAFRYDYSSDTIEDLHNESLYRFSEGYGINENGDVVGWAKRLSDGADVPMVWTVDGREIALETFDLGPAHGLSQAEHINNHGQVVGVDVSFAPEPPIGWIVFDVPIFLGAHNDGTGNPGNGQADANGIGTTMSNGIPAGNGIGSAQQIVPKKHVLASFLSTEDQTLWTRLHPFEINEAGQICGIGVMGTSTRGFLMTPEPILAGDLNLDGTVDQSDAEVILSNLGKSKEARPLEGDLDRDRDVDYDDLKELVRLMSLSSVRDSHPQVGARMTK